MAAIVADDPEAAAGVNDRVDLAACEAAIQRRLREDLMRARRDDARPVGRLR